MMIWIGFLTIPVFIFLGFLFVAIGRAPPREGYSISEYVIAGLQYFCCLLSFGLCGGGVMRLAEEFNVFQDAGILYLSIPAMVLFALGSACWFDGYWKGVRKGTNNLLDVIRNDVTD